MTWVEHDERLQMMSLPAWSRLIADLEGEHDALADDLERAFGERLAVTHGRWVASRQLLATLRNMREESRQKVEEHYAQLEKTLTYE